MLFHLFLVFFRVCVFVFFFLRHHYTGTIFFFCTHFYFPASWSQVSSLLPPTISPHGGYSRGDDAATPRLQQHRTEMTFRRVNQPWSSDAADSGSFRLFRFRLTSCGPITGNENTYAAKNCGDRNGGDDGPRRQIANGWISSNQPSLNDTTACFFWGGLSYLFLRHCCPIVAPTNGDRNGEDDHDGR